LTGECYKCGENGHRRHECPTKDDGKPDKGGPPKGKGDKGKGTGKGKTFDAASIAEAGTVPVAAGLAIEDAWWLNTIIIDSPNPAAASQSGIPGVATVQGSPSA
jgi:hypothetical protein